MTRTLKVRHRYVTLVKESGGWGRSRVVELWQDWWCQGRILSVLTPGVTKDKIFSNLAALPWFCRQELPRGRGILTLSRICCRRDFSLIGRRAGTQWRAPRDPLLPDAGPGLQAVPGGSQHQNYPAVTLQPGCLALLALPVLLCHPCFAHARVPSLLSASTADPAPGPFPAPQPKLCASREGIW